MKTKTKGLHNYKITEKWYFYIDFFGLGFSHGSWVIIPTMSCLLKKGYYQLTFTWLHRSIDFTFNYG